VDCIRRQIRLGVPQAPLPLSVSRAAPLPDEHARSIAAYDYIVIVPNFSLVWTGQKACLGERLGVEQPWRSPRQAVGQPSKFDGQDGLKVELRLACRQSSVTQRSLQRPCLSPRIQVQWNQSPIYFTVPLWRTASDRCSLGPAARGIFHLPVFVSLRLWRFALLQLSTEYSVRSTPGLRTP
jgi:hypothetical protein